MDFLRAQPGQIRLWSSHAAQHPPIAHTNLTLASEQGCNFNKYRSLHLHQKQDRSAECFLSLQSHRQESCWLYTIKSYAPCTPAAHTETHHSLNAVPGTNLPAGRELPAQLEIQPMGGFQTRLQLLCSSSSCKTSSCFLTKLECLLLSLTAAPESWLGKQHLGHGAAGWGSGLCFSVGK